MSNNIIKFLTDLRENNNRNWFNENKNRYEEARTQFKDIVDNLIPLLANTNPLIRNLESKDTIFRIYRDVRFSHDKSPYKTTMGAYMAPGGRKSLYAGHYLHLEPGNCFLAGGSYRPLSEQLKNIRSEIYYNIDEFKSIIYAKDFVKLFNEVVGDKLKRPPVGFPKDFIDVELLKFKDYTVFHQIDDKAVTIPGFLKETIDIFEKINQFNDFLNRALI